MQQKTLGSLIESLKEPHEDQELRFSIKDTDFKTYGEQVLAALTRFVSTQTDWQAVPNNYEGIRVACLGENEQGWFLLRLSLHDPVLALNMESNVAGGVDIILARLMAFMAGFSALELK
jgi:phosphomannomutase